jgi:hypothetical protein
MFIDDEGNQYADTKYTCGSCYKECRDNSISYQIVRGEMGTSCTDERCKAIVHNLLLNRWGLKTLAYRVGRMVLEKPVAKPNRHHFV